MQYGFTKSIQTNSNPLTTNLGEGFTPPPTPALVYPPLSGVVPVCVCVCVCIKKLIKSQAKINQNRPKIDKKITKKLPKLNLGGVQGGLGKLLAANTER